MPSYILDSAGSPIVQWQAIM